MSRVDDFEHEPLGAAGIQAEDDLKNSWNVAACAELVRAYSLALDRSERESVPL